MDEAEDIPSPPGPEPWHALSPPEHAPPPSAQVPAAPVAAGPARVPRSLVALLVVVALIVGGGATFAALRLSNNASGSVHIQVDNAPLAVTGTTAAAVAQKLGPAVATIIAVQGSTGSSLGSGFVIAHDGGTSYLVTNNHVVTGSTNLHVVMPNGDAYTATLVGADTLDDLAVVSVPNGSLPLATFGDSSALVVGEPVIAIGSPLGNQSSVTSGIISSLHRTITAGGEPGAASETLQDVLQTDASINPGNSGGPLADLQGRVVGVNVAIAGNSTNIGYSIPANVARDVATELISHQPVQHPFLGIAYLSLIDAIEAGRGFTGPGVLVTTVTAGTPAAAAGFHVNDILTAVDGVAIDNGETLGGLIQNKHVADHVQFTVKRGGATVTLTATLEERPGNL